MAYQGFCAHCGSYDMIAGLDKNQCLHCGLHTDSNGNAVAPLDAPTKEGA